MIDIVYPARPAPIMRGGEGGTSAEMLPIVMEDGMVIRQASRAYCHSGAKPLHPVVHLHIMNREGEIYLQQRSFDKDLLPGYWDTAVGGHVSYGEHIREALCREAGEELGFYDFNPIHVKTYVFESQIEREMVFVFAAVGNFELHPDNDEVIAGKFWSPKQIEATIGKRILTPNFEQEYTAIKTALAALL